MNRCMFLFPFFFSYFRHSGLRNNNAILNFVSARVLWGNKKMKKSKKRKGKTFPLTARHFPPSTLPRTDFLPARANKHQEILSHTNFIVPDSLDCKGISVRYSLSWWSSDIDNSRKKKKKIPLALNHSPLHVHPTGQSVCLWLWQRQQHSRLGDEIETTTAAPKWKIYWMGAYWGSPRNRRWMPASGFEWEGTVFRKK